MKNCGGTPEEFLKVIREILEQFLKEFQEEFEDELIEEFKEKMGGVFGRISRWIPGGICRIYAVRVFEEFLEVISEELAGGIARGIPSRILAENSWGIPEKFQK